MLRGLRLRAAFRLRFRDDAAMITVICCDLLEAHEAPHGPPETPTASKKRSDMNVNLVRIAPFGFMVAGTFCSGRNQHSHGAPL